jgi:hypothetical protein
MVDTAMLGAGEVISTGARLAKKRATKEKFAIPEGWIARGFMFEVMAHRP